MKNILALDLATKTGWATGSRPTEITSGVQDFSLQRGDSSGMRYLRFESWLTDVITLVHPEVIIYEQAHQRGGAPTEIAYGFITHTLKICAKYQIEHQALHTGTLKKFWTGKGNAGKSEMIAECRRRGFSPRDDNEADAIALLHWGLEHC